MQAYAIRRDVDLPFHTTVEKVREELQKEGFGVLTEIDVQAKMKEKLDRHMGRYLILGACAPPLAWDALQAKPDMGVFLPCNVCVYEADGGVVVTAMEPEVALSLVRDDEVERVASEASERLHRVMEAL